MAALSAEKSAIEKAAALAGQLERVLEENKAMAIKVKDLVVNAGTISTDIPKK
jgi:hypothetical protein